MQLSEEHLLIQETARRFAADRLAPNAEAWDRALRLIAGIAALVPGLASEVAGFGLGMALILFHRFAAKSAANQHSSIPNKEA